MTTNRGRGEDGSRLGGSLAGMIGEVARALLGEPNRHLSSRHELRFGSKGSIAVSLDRGVFFDHEAGSGGGVVDLVRRHVGSEPGAVARWLEAFGVDPLKNETARRVSVPRGDVLSAEDEQVRQRAVRIWREASRCLAGTPAEAYLRSRGIWGPGRDAVLRFARLAHPDTGEVLPCIIVPRVDVGKRRVNGVQRIFLTEGGEKYRDGKAKLCLGRGALVAALFDPAECLGLAEGVETALSAMKFGNGKPVWATCGGFPATMDLPKVVRSVLIMADHDANGGSFKKANILAASLRANGIDAEAVMFDNEGDDANDALETGGALTSA